MPEITESTEVRADDNCLSTTLDGETVILHMEEGTYYGFNDVGTFVWESLQRSQTVEEVCQSVAAEYDVEYGECHEDVKQMIAELVQKDLAYSR